jgi:hypothetical protein
MEMALTLVSIASFFAMVLSWLVLPAAGASRAEAIQALRTSQVAS